MTAKQEKPRFCFGLPFMLGTPTIADAVSLCRQAGLAFVELNSNFPQCELGSLDADELRVLAADAGIFFTLHLDDRFDAFDFNQRVRQAYMDTMLAAIELAATAGIPVINIHIARGNIVTLPDGPHYLYAEYPDAFHEAIRIFRDRCTAAIGSSGIRIAVENTDGWEAYERTGIRLLLESPVFGLTLDIGHDHATRHLDLPFFQQEKRLIHMHAHDGWGETNHQPLGTGEIPLDRFLRQACEAEATVVLEVKTPEALKQSADWLISNDWI